MKKFFPVLFFSFLLTDIIAQVNIDSLKSILQSSENDTTKLNTLVKLSGYYRWRVPDSSIHYSLVGLELAKKLNREKEQVGLYQIMGEALSSGKGNFSLALETHLKGLKLAEKIKNEDDIAYSNTGIGAVYFYSNDFKTALPYFKKAKEFPMAYLKREEGYAGFIGETYFHLGEIDSALKYLQRSYELELKNPSWSVPYYYMGKIYAKKGQHTKAVELYRNGLNVAFAGLDKIEGYNGIAKIFEDMKNTDSAIYYSTKGLTYSQEMSFDNKIIESSVILKDVYKTLGLIDSAFKYQEIMLEAKDSLYSQEKVKQLQNLAFNEQLKEKELIAEREAQRTRLKIYGLIVLGTVFLLITILLWRNNKQKQRSKDRIEKAYGELKNAQAQLIQSEKMASLGELTAGIAHEIQNPLNFVNNFSDVNAELVDDARQEMDKGNFDEVTAILDNIKDNEQKINHHGKRADAIVKNMLQHSRASSGHKELTDINVLADEYLKLAYHGMRAKDKLFNAITKSEFDNSIGKINIVPQEIGRVILNLINNAFYAVNEKKNSNPNGYEPIVIVTSAKINGKVEIKVIDNGNGIPQQIISKIFQPFFTTKPTGQGTGLGLSLAYDIITKGHNGELKVETKEGEGSAFIIQLNV